MIRRHRPVSIPTVHDAIVDELGKIFPRAVGNITGKTHLYDNLGVDSLDAVELSMALEDRLGIEIGPDYLRGIETVGALINKLESMK